MKRIRILLVDNSPIFRDAAATFLAAFTGLELVGTASSGAAGVRLAEMLAPDLVLMDLAMPGMDGLAATALLKAREHPPRVTIVTLHDDTEHRQRAREVGADGFVSKAAFLAGVLDLIEGWYPGATDNTAAWVA